MIVLCTDFGPAGPYLGQVRAVLLRAAPEVPVIDLFSDLPPFDAQAAAYLLAAYAPEFPSGTVFLAVVDPGVGSARAPLAVRADGRWYVGPDNGILALVVRRAGEARAWEITWQPHCLSATFHGRDIFAPVAARLARGEDPPGRERDPRVGPGSDWPDDLPRIVYLDRFGNAMTGLRAGMLAPEAALEVRGRPLPRARTFSDLPAGSAFWYENANGLAEIAVSNGSAARELGLSVGAEVAVVPSAARQP